MQTLRQERAIHVIGIELCTSNDQAFQTIPGHWARFTREKVLEQLPQRLGGDVFAVYTNFENAGRDNSGIYSLVIGAQVPAGTPLPAGMVRAVVPASQRAVFEVAAGRHDQVGRAWQDIWQRTGLHKTFIAEYERYQPDGRIEISIGLQEEK